MNEVDHFRELNKDTNTGGENKCQHYGGPEDQNTLHFVKCCGVLLHFTRFPDSSYLSANIMSDHLLNHNVCQRLEVLDKLLVLVVSSFFLNEELKQRSLLPADSSHVGCFLSHPEQQPQQISHA